jgi:hypothetical protein
MTTLPVVTVTVTVAGMYKSECGMLLEGGKKGDETRQAEESPPNSKPAGQGPGLFQWAGMKEGGLGLLGRLRLEWEGPSIGGVEPGVSHWVRRVFLRRVCRQRAGRQTHCLLFFAERGSSAASPEGQSLDLRDSACQGQWKPQVSSQA